MALYKRGAVWWFEFVFNGERIRESTKQGNRRTAEQTKRPSRITFKRAGRSNPGAALHYRRDQSTANWRRCAGCCVSPTNGRRFSGFPEFGCCGASTRASRS